MGSFHARSFFIAASHGTGGHHRVAAFAEADAAVPVAFAKAAQNHRVAVLEEAAGLPVRQADRLAAALGQLQQRAGFLGPRPG